MTPLNEHQLQVRVTGEGYGTTIHWPVEPPDYFWIYFNDDRTGRAYKSVGSMSEEKYDALREERARVDAILDRHLDGETYNRVLEQIELVKWIPSEGGTTALRRVGRLIRSEGGTLDA